MIHDSNPQAWAYVGACMLLLLKFYSVCSYSAILSLYNVFCSFYPSHLFVVLFLSGTGISKNEAAEVRDKCLAFLVKQIKVCIVLLDQSHLSFLCFLFLLCIWRGLASYQCKIRFLLESCSCSLVGSWNLRLCNELLTFEISVVYGFVSVVMQCPFVLTWFMIHEIDIK